MGNMIVSERIPHKMNFPEGEVGSRCEILNVDFIRKKCSPKEIGIPDSYTDN